jgi:hypothetical protein
MSRVLAGESVRSVAAVLQESVSSVVKGSQRSPASLRPDRTDALPFNQDQPKTGC